MGFPTWCVTAKTSGAGTGTEQARRDLAEEMGRVESDGQDGEIREEDEIWGGLVVAERERERPGAS